MSGRKTSDAALFEQTLTRARAIAREIPRLRVHEPKGTWTYAIDLRRFAGANRLEPYGRRFLYRDLQGRWMAIDALVSSGCLVGVGFHPSSVAANWVSTITKARRRKHPEADLTRPIFLMTPGFNLHFLSFSKKGGKTPVFYLHLHDGVRPKPRARFIESARLKSFHVMLEDYTREGTSRTRVGAKS